MKNARFLRMVETIFGSGFLYRLSEPFYGSHHVFVTPDYLVRPCTVKGHMHPRIIPWLVPEASSLPEVFEGIGYNVAI